MTASRWCQLRAALRFAVVAALSALLVLLLAASPDGASAELAAKKARRQSERALSSAGIEPFSRNPSETRPRAVCPPPTETRATCLSAVVPKRLAARRRAYAAGPHLQGSGERGGFSPVDLRSAYNLPSEGGAGVTIAITIAFDYPTAEADLAVYRKTYGLPPCTGATGCFRKVNQEGKAEHLPGSHDGWAAEAALDLDMASAICPECKLLLVEAKSNDYEDLPQAVSTAAKLGADVISNSWGSEEFSKETSFDQYFNHPGIPALFASGDWGNVVSYPSASPDVTAVGGTSLYKDESARGWRERAWGGAGSGCSAYEKKPSWQTDGECPRRTTADVSAVADPHTPVSVYDTYGRYEGWLLFGGTSVATPVLAGVEALSSAAERAKGAERFWEEGPEGKLFDVGEGRSGPCGPEAIYLCVAILGYDGPTGWGTPGGSRPGTPMVGTYTPSNITPHEATLNGAVNPNGDATTYHFEYDTSPYENKGTHGANVPVSGASAGSGGKAVDVTEVLTGLTLGVTYHYRLVATSSHGTTYGGDHTFTASHWSAQHMPRNIEEREEMEGVSCASTSACVAVGWEGVYFKGLFYNSAPLIESWDGSTWTRESVPVYHPPASGYASDLADVSCSAPAACMAVGENYEIEKGFLPLVEHLDGEEWSLIPAPIPNDAGKAAENQYNVRLYGISCSSEVSCVLVGMYVDKSLVDRGLIESWDGSSWTVQPSPNPPGEDRLFGVSCLSTTSCVAVGESRNSIGGNNTLVERWNGTKWSIDPGPALAGGLQDISCSKPDECVAVGASDGVFGGSGVAEIWNGSQWIATPLALPMRGVSCPKVKWCIATGGDNESHQAYAELWDGSGWTVENPVLPFDASDNVMRMYDVSCAGTGCTSVGWYWSWGYQPLGERLDGFLAPQPPGVTNDPVGTVTRTSARLRGHVNNNGLTGGSSCHFEVALRSKPGSPIMEPACGPELVEGVVSTPVQAVAAGLSPDTEYVYRVVATNEGGVGTGTPDLEFRTAHNYFLTATAIGGGTGSITSSPAGIACSGTCTAEFKPGEEVELSATAEPGSEFREWRGACSGSGLCRMTMSGDDVREVTAFFTRKRQRLTLEKGGSGAGTVKGKLTVNCPANCGDAEAKLYEGSVVTLTARPAVGSAFAGWSGCDSQPEGKCVVTMNGARLVRASFAGTAKAIASPRVLALAKAGTGQGTVKSQPAGIACEVNCVATKARFAGEVAGSPGVPSTVALYATPSPGSQLTEWLNCPLVEGNVCRVTMTSAKSVAARFDE